MASLPDTGNEESALRPVLAVLALCASLAAQADTLPTLAYCDSGDYASVLWPAPTAAIPEAHAIWLDPWLVRWPGIHGSGRFRLLYSADGQAVAEPGSQVHGADGALDLEPYSDALPAELAAQYRHVAAGVTLRATADTDTLRKLHRQQLLLVQQDAAGRVRRATRLQSPGALDGLYGAAADAKLGVTVAHDRTTVAVWAPTARNVAVCLYLTGDGPAQSAEKMQRDPQTGVWSANIGRDLSGVVLQVHRRGVRRGVGLVRNLVTDRTRSA